MKLVNGAQMKEIDGKAIKDIGIPGIVLMENAAIKAFQQLEHNFEVIKTFKIGVL